MRCKIEISCNIEQRARAESGQERKLAIVSDSGHSLVRHKGSVLPVEQIHPRDKLSISSDVLDSLRNDANGLSDTKERHKTLELIQKLEQGVQDHERGMQEIQRKFAAPAPRISRFKLFGITLLMGGLAWLFTGALLSVLEKSGYTERHTGRFVTEATDVIAYWWGVGFFAFSSTFSLVLTVACIFSLLTYPVPLLDWLRGRR